MAMKANWCSSPPSLPCSIELLDFSHSSLDQIHKLYCECEHTYELVFLLWPNLYSPSFHPSIGQKVGHPNGGLFFLLINVNVNWRRQNNSNGIIVEGGRE